MIYYIKQTGFTLILVRKYKIEYCEIILFRTSYAKNKRYFSLYF